MKLVFISLFTLLFAWGTITTDCAQGSRNTDCKKSAEFDDVSFMNENTIIGVKNQTITLMNGDYKTLGSYSFTGTYHSYQTLSKSRFSLHTNRETIHFDTSDGLKVSNKALVPFDTESLDDYFFLKEGDIQVSIQIKESKAAVEVINGAEKILDATYGFKMKDRNTINKRSNIIFVKSLGIIYFSLPYSEKFLIVDINSANPKINMKFIDYQAAAKADDSYWYHDPVTGQIYFLINKKEGQGARLFNITKEHEVKGSSSSQSVSRGFNPNWESYHIMDIPFIPNDIFSGSFQITGGKENGSQCNYMIPLKGNKTPSEVWQSLNLK